MKKILSLFLITVLLVNIFVPSSIFAKELLDKREIESFVDKYFQEKMEEHVIPGAVFAIVQNGELLYSKGYGYSDVENEIQVSPEETVFRIGSVSKIFTATGIMQLTEKGLIDLHTDSNEYNKLFQLDYKNGTPVTIHNLLTHTAGFDESGKMTIVLKQDDLQSIGENLKEHMPKQVREAGIETQYSNHGYGLLGHLLEEVTGQSFEDYMQEHILQPLEMKDSSFYITKEMNGKLSKSYTHFNGQNLETDPMYFHFGAAGALNATATDMVNFMKFHLANGEFNGKRLLKEETIELMHHTQYTNHPDLPGMAYGAFIEQRNKLVNYHHGGTIDGFQSLVYFIPEHNVAFFISTNSNLGAHITFNFPKDFVNHFYGDEGEGAAPVNTVAVTSEKELQAFAGSYQMNRSPKMGPQKVAVLQLGGTELKVLGDGRVAIQDMLDKNRFKEYVEVEPLKFQEVDGDQQLLLQVNENGEKQFLVSEWPAWTYNKIKWYENYLFHTIVLISLVVIVQISLLSFPIAWIIRKIRKKKDQHPLQTNFRKWGWGVSVVNFLFIIGSALTLGLSSMMYQTWMVIALTIPFVSFILVIVLWKKLYKLQSEKVGSVFSRVCYSILVVGGTLLLPLAWYWDLIIFAL